MNIFGFELIDTIQGLYFAFLFGLFIGGGIFGLIRMLLLSVFERREA